MKLLSQQQVFSQNVAKLINFIFASGYKCTFGEAQRSPEQAAIYAKQGKGISDSLHCKRLAVDLNLFDAKNTYLIDTADYKPFGDYWLTLHKDNEWGGIFKGRPDGNHFQMKEPK